MLNLMLLWICYEQIPSSKKLVGVICFRSILCAWLDPRYSCIWTIMEVWTEAVQCEHKLCNEEWSAEGANHPKYFRCVWVSLSLCPFVRPFLSDRIRRIRHTPTLLPYPARLFFINFPFDWCASVKKTPQSIKSIHAEYATAIFVNPLY